VACGEKDGDRQPESEGQQGSEFDGRNTFTGARQFHAAFEADREQQQRADEIVDGRRQAQLGPGQARECAQQEEQDDGIQVLHETSFAARGSGARVSQR
jgi:3-isopropylmalate dehydratase small subunit